MYRVLLVRLKQTFTAYQSAMYPAVTKLLERPPFDPESAVDDAAQATLFLVTAAVPLLVVREASDRPRADLLACLWSKEETLSLALEHRSLVLKAAENLGVLREAIPSPEAAFMPAKARAFAIFGLVFSLSLNPNREAPLRLRKA